MSKPHAGLRPRHQEGIFKFEVAESIKRQKKRLGERAQALA